MVTLWLSTRHPTARPRSWEHLGYFMHLFCPYVMSCTHFALNYCEITLNLIEISSTACGGNLVKHIALRNSEKKLVCIAFHTKNRSCSYMLSAFKFTVIGRLPWTLHCINQLFLSNCQTVYLSGFPPSHFFRNQFSNKKIFL